MGWGAGADWASWGVGWGAGAMTLGTALVAGASGSIGAETARELQSRGWRVRALAREPSRLSVEVEEIFVGNLQNRRTLEGVCDGVEAVVSCAGAPLRRGSVFGGGRGETFARVDDAGNRNLLERAVAAGVRRFGYVSAYGGRFLGMNEYIRAHESFAAALRSSGVSSLVARPTTTFARLAPLVERARRRGRLTVLGTGEARTNPVHEGDVARALVDGLEGGVAELDIGGPEVLTQGEIAELAAEAAGGAAVGYSYAWRAQARAGLLRLAGGRSRDVALHELSLTGVDIVAPAVGERRLGDYFAGLGG